MSGNNKSDDISEDESQMKSLNECNFWELISDVAKDLDVTLQDLSPDLEISNKINNGNIDENASIDTPAMATKQSSNAVLFEPIVIRITGNNDPKQANAESEESLNNINSEDEVKPSSPPSPAPSLPLISQSTIISAHNKKPVSYCSQLLSLMDNKLIANENSKSESISLVSNHPEGILNLKLKENNAEMLKESDACNDDNDANSAASNESITVSIGLLERLIRCHSIWFLPEIGRAGVVHLLQGKESGAFIVRQSSKTNTMALSVRLPEGRGPHIEHYLIEDEGSGKLHLEGSDNYFNAIPMLVCHYCNCCDELPVQLNLPKVVAQSSRHQLTSLALLGQDFWQSSLSKLSNQSDNNSDNHSNSSNSQTAKSPTLCTPFKTDPPPPPVPPKNDVSNLDPIIDTKKSSAVTMSVMIGNPTPKLPPRRTEPPPIPPRKLLLNQKANQANEANQTNSNCNSVSKCSPPSSNTTLVTNISVGSPQTAPNTEITLIEVNDANADGLSISSFNSTSSHLNDNVPQDIFKILPNCNKKVACYRSALNDKESDYEDIWGANNLAKITLNSTRESSKESILTNDKLEKSTQTDLELEQSTQTETKQSLKPEVDRRLSSPLYIEPIDSLNGKFQFPDSSQLSHSDIKETLI